MHLNAALAILAASRVALAAPAAEETQVDPALRLIKTSEADAGTWVTEDQKIEEYVNKHIGFIDITDIVVRVDYLIDLCMKLTHQRTMRSWRSCPPRRRRSLRPE